jgi:hypothetical protein
MHRDAAKAYLDATKSVKSEIDWDEVYELFNPYHSKKDGKFTSKKGASGVGGGSSAGAQKSEGGKAPPKKWTGKRLAAAVASSTVTAISGSIIGGFYGGAAGMAIGKRTSTGSRAGLEIGAIWGNSLGTAVGAYIGAKAVTDEVNKRYARDLKKWRDETNSALSNVKSEDNNMDELVQLQQQLEEERERAEQLEAERNAAQERAMQLERDALNGLVDSVVELSKNHRDSEGRALPTSFTEWVAKFLKFGEFGKDEDVVKLEEEQRPGNDFVRYAAKAIQTLILSMPGLVPAERQTHSGDDDDGEEFDYKEVWED